MKVSQGEVYYYRTYDVGDEVDLKLASSLMEADTTPSWFQLRKLNRSILIEDKPVVMNLGGWQQEIGGKVFNVQSVGKIWSFGGFSVCFIFELPCEHTLDELNLLGNYIDYSDDIQAIADEKVKKVCSSISPAIKNIKIWKEYEDFLLYNIKCFAMDYSQAELLSTESLYKLIVGSKGENLSEQTKDNIRKNIFTYTTNDLVIMDWNSALVYDPTDYKDIADVIEFALVQLLEMRYYDNTLDEKLNSLYKGLDNRKNHGLLNNNYGEISKEAAKIYIEISEIIEKIENSLKVIGDFYYAQIFRAASDKFRFKDWQQSVDSKLNNLAEVSKLFQGEINERRNQMMEVIVIVLIAMEVIPFLYNLVAGTGTH